MDRPFEELHGRAVIEHLADTYRQLYVSPGPDGKEKYLDIVGRGNEPEARDLSHFITSEEDSLIYEGTPAGTVTVVTLARREDFVTFLRIMASVIYHETAFYHIRDVIRYVYLIMSVYNFKKFERENGKKQFFSLWIYVIPVLCGSLVEYITGYNAFTLGAAIGTTMLYILFCEKISYKDEKSGFYNIQYLNRLYELARAGKCHPHVVMSYTLPAIYDVKAFCSELTKVLPEGCDTIGTESNAYITVIYGNTRGLVNILSEDIHMIADRLDLDIELEIFTKTKMESPIDFLEKVVKLK